MRNPRKTTVRLHTSRPVRFVRDVAAGPKTWLSLWRKRRKYDSFAEMPDALVVFFFVSATVVASALALLLADVLPHFWKAASTVPLARWGVTGWGLSAFLLLTAFVNFHHTQIALQCQSVIRQRWYR